jgi:ribulose 1,5-bisphosphate synthetase/thiazole synthase
MVIHCSWFRNRNDTSAHSSLEGSYTMSKIASDLASLQMRSISSNAAVEQRKPTHVGIIGAGVAALRCADVLLQHGVKVTIIEARDRLGGRVSCNSMFEVKP